jgi:hypothetical protein
MAKDGLVDVVLHVVWPSYDFIFGFPAPSNKNYGKEAALFQYRDTRRKTVNEGFYVDKTELKHLAKGFSKLLRSCR